jgi:hypothetical protein
MNWFSLEWLSIFRRFLCYFFLHLMGVINTICVISWRSVLLTEETAAVSNKFTNKQI